MSRLQTLLLGAAGVQLDEVEAALTEGGACVTRGDLLPLGCALVVLLEPLY